MASEAMPLEVVVEFDRNYMIVYEFTNCSFDWVSGGNFRKYFRPPTSQQEN